MIKQLELAPCPFCEGPPCVSAHESISMREVFVDHPYLPELDESYEAHIWCHDCGARGPRIDTISLSIFEHRYDLSVYDTMKIAAERWNDRHSKARACYDAGAVAGLNMFPRNNDLKGEAP